MFSKIYQLEILEQENEWNDKQNLKPRDLRLQSKHLTLFLFSAIVLESI